MAVSPSRLTTFFYCWHLFGVYALHISVLLILDCLPTSIGRILFWCESEGTWSLLSAIKLNQPLFRCFNIFTCLPFWKMNIPTCVNFMTNPHNSSCLLCCYVVFSLCLLHVICVSHACHLLICRTSCALSLAYYIYIAFLILDICLSFFSHWS